MQLPSCIFTRTVDVSSTRIAQLNAPTVLHLQSNQLASPPPESGQLNALSLLRLQSNQLASPPPEIGQLHALTGLHFCERLVH